MTTMLRRHEREGARRGAGLRRWDGGGGRGLPRRKEGEDFGKQVAGEGFDAFADAILRAGLGDVVGGAAGEGFDGDAGAARGEGAAHDDGDAAIAAADAGEDFEAVHAGHFDVEQDEVGMEALEGGEAVLAAGRGGSDFDGGFGSRTMRSRLRMTAESSTRRTRILARRSADRWSGS